MTENNPRRHCARCGQDLTREQLICHRTYCSRTCSNLANSRCTSPVRSEADRFWEKVDKNGPVPAHRPDLGPCWIWTASLAKGYGQTTVKKNGRKTSVVAHRLAYQMIVGAVPLHMQLDHLCRLTYCVNPDHLEPVTPIVNSHRSWADRRSGLNSMSLSPKRSAEPPTRGKYPRSACQYPSRSHVRREPSGE